MNTSEQLQMSVRVLKNEVESVIEVGAYSEDVYYVVLNRKRMWMGPFVPELLFVSLPDDTTLSRINLPENRYFLGAVAKADQSVFVYSNRIDHMLNINICTVGSDYIITLNHTFSTAMSCCGSGLTTSFVSSKIDEYVLWWGNLSNDEFFYQFTVKKLCDTPSHTSTCLQRIECEDVHACLRFRTVEVLYPTVDESVYHCQARGVGPDAPDRLTVIVYHAGLISREKAKVAFCSIIELPFELHYEDNKLAECDHAYFGCDAIIHRVLQAQSGSLVCLVRVYVSEWVPPALENSEVEAAVATTTTHKTRKSSESKAVFLLLSLEGKKVLDMLVTDVWTGKCTVDFTGRHIVHVAAKDS